MNTERELGKNVIEGRVSPYISMQGPNSSQLPKKSSSPISVLTLCVRS